jgi:hypothetical protein
MPNNAILFDIMTQVKTSIVNRGLTGIDSTNVLILKVPVNLVKELPKPPNQWPAIIICPWGAEDLNPGDESCQRDDVIYHVAVAIVAADNTDQSAHFNEYLFWRESIRKLFNAQPLPLTDNVPVNGTSYNAGKLCMQIWVKPLDIVDRKAWIEIPMFASGLILRCRSRETRG